MQKMTKFKKYFSVLNIFAVGIISMPLSAYGDAETNALIGDAKSGGQMYNAVCKGCHGVSIGPNLRGVLGRPIASENGFPNYTDALKALKEKSWTKENLDLFLINPTEFAPGTNMIQTIPDAQKRADVIAFFEVFVPRK